MVTDDKDLHGLIVNARNVNHLMRLARQNGMKLTRGVAQRLYASVHGEPVPTQPTAPAEGAPDTEQ